MDIRPFEIAIADESLDDLRRRLGAVRWPDSLDTDSWDDGASVSFMRRMADHWRNHFDWRAQETRLNGLRQFMATVDGFDIHFVHQPGRGPAPLPLIMTHGWPGSFVEMEQIIPLLADPAAHGADPADSFDVVVPSLPGYGFSQAPSRPGVSSREIATLWRGLMCGLGYQRFAAQGGDIGAGVSTWLARLFPENLVGAHINFIPSSYRPHLGVGAPPVTLDEQRFLDRIAAWSAAEGAYAQMHGTKPTTLAHALSDSPIGLAAWITEKFRTWSDCDGDVGRVFSMDALLTDISLYWFSRNLDASFRLYKENRREPMTFVESERATPPLGVAIFPRELPMPPRSWVARAFNVTRWTQMPRGGHFAAMEQPRLLAEDIRAFFGPLRHTAGVS